MKHKYNKTFFLEVIPATKDSKEPAFKIKFKNPPTRDIVSSMCYDLQMSIPSQTIAQCMGNKLTEQGILVINHKNAKKFKNKIIKIIENYVENYS